MSSRLFTALAASLAAGAADAQTSATEGRAPLEEVVVSASLRGQAAHELPASLTVLDGHTLASAGVQHFQDVLGLVPNLNWAAGSSRPRYFQLRGIGELEQYQGAPNPSVGFLIDDIDFSGIGMPATLFDVERIEVLRGPQGTLYGANALAGMINVRTREARAEPELSVEATAAEHGTHAAGAIAGGGFGAGERAAWRLVAQSFRSDGSRYNSFLDRHDTNGYDETHARAKVKWEVTDALRLDLTALHANLDNGYDAFSIDNSRVTLSDDPGRDAQRSQGLAARVTYSGYAGFELRSVTTWADSDIEYSFDGDWGNDRDWGAFAPYDFTQRFLRDRRTVSQDLRLVSTRDLSGGARTAWTVGAYLLDTRETNDQLDRFNGEVFRALTSRYDATNAAGYGELDVAITRRARVAIGARIERREAAYEDSDGMDVRPAQTLHGGHLALEYDLAPGRLAYATVSRGYKAGGFNIGASIPAGRTSYDAEYVTSFETGLKARTADARLAGQLAAFFMRRSDQQVATSEQLDPGDPLSFVFFNDNAASGENYGLELAATWRASERWRLSGALGVLETRYVGYRFAGRDLDGREQAHAPEYQLALAGEYRHPLGFMARVDIQATDDFFFDASHDERADPFRLVNLKFGYELGRWGAWAWARNLFDERLAMRGFFFGNEPPDFQARRYVQNADPRQLGFTVTYSFH